MESERVDIHFIKIVIMLLRFIIEKKVKKSEWRGHITWYYQDVSDLGLQHKKEGTKTQKKTKKIWKLKKEFGRKNVTENINKNKQNFKCC